MLGTQHRQNPIRRPHGLPMWQLIFCVSGSGSVRLEGRRSMVRPGQLLLLSPSEQHSYAPAGGEWVVHYLGFTGSACRSLLSALGLVQSGVCHLGHPEQFLGHVQTLEGILSENLPEKHLLCSKELYGALLDLSLDITRVTQAEYEQVTGLAREVILYLEDHYGEELTLDVLSAQFHLAPEYLCTRFKAETGQTIMQYLKGIRIHQAKLRLMEMPDASLAEIGALCGFHSLSYFGKVFREATGFTPHAYRLGVFLKE